MDSGRISSMAAKNDIDITIGGKTFTLSGVESEAYLREVASYLNAKLKDFSDDAAYWKLPNDMRNVMLQLNLADDYFKEQDKVAELERRMDDIRQEAREEVGQELSSLKQELQETRQKAEADLKDTIDRTGAAYKDLEESSARELNQTRASHAMQLKEIREAAAAELSSVREKAAADLDQTKRNAAQAMEQAREADKKEITSLKGRLASIDMEHARQVREIRQEADRKLSALRAETTKAYTDMETSLKETIESERQDRQKLVDAEKARLRDQFARAREEDRQKMEAARQKMDEEMEAAQELINEQQSELDQLKKELDQGREQARQTAAELSAKISALQKEKEGLTGEIAGLNEELGSLQEEKTGLEITVEQMRAETETLKDDIAARKQVAKMTAAQIEALTKSREAMDAVIGRLEEIKEKLA